ncbi:MAG: hypothetical protein GY836_20645, partial [Herbaspirillum sp.]|uniref:hypothetical protein n=1 Tax=Herbaspirillum sp. TaxID=1890675 RepID=UPI0025854707
RFPVSAEDLELAALIASPATIPDDVIRPQLCDVLARSPLGPAMWKVREIEWAVAVPPVFPEPLPGIAALDRWRIAGELVDELLGLPGEDRAAAVRSAGYRSSLVVHQLLVRCREQRFDDVERNLELAELGVAVAASLLSDGSAEWHRWRGLYALALINSANAHRMCGDLVGARKLLAKGETFVLGDQDALLQGIYHVTKASVLIYTRCLADARSASIKALASFRTAGDRHWSAKVLLHLSYIDFASGELSEESLDRLRSARHMAEPFREAHLRDVARMNLARYEAESHRLEQALKTWKEIRPFRQRILELRRIGLLGVIQLAGQRWVDAAHQFSFATEGLAAIGHCDAHYYRLYLARSLEGAGRNAEALHEALGAARFFASLRIESVATIARTMVAEAATGTVCTVTIAALIKAVESSPGGIPGLPSKCTIP